jgi:RNA polymerase subunit RPABC4/transcription elongation factor Spt4
MKVCPKCKNTIAFDAEYCPFDGVRLVELYKCKNCGTELQNGFSYCFKCGTKAEVKP